jgi:hypothetical protein
VQDGGNYLIKEMSDVFTPNVIQYSPGYVEIFCHYISSAIFFELFAKHPKIITRGN